MTRMPPAVEMDVVVGPKAEGARRATGAFGPTATSAAMAPDPEVPAKAQRRRFTAEYRLRILKQADACKRPGAACRTRPDRPARRPRRQRRARPRRGSGAVAGIPQRLERPPADHPAGRQAAPDPHRTDVHWPAPPTGRQPRAAPPQSLLRRRRRPADRPGRERAQSRLPAVAGRLPVSEPRRHDAGPRARAGLPREPDRRG